MAVTTFGPERTLLDVCDRCRAIAMLHAVFPTTGYDLWLCWSHYMRHRQALELLDIHLVISPPAGQRLGAAC